MPGVDRRSPWRGPRDEPAGRRAGSGAGAPLRARASAYDAHLERIGFGAYRRRLSVRARDRAVVEAVESGLSSGPVWRRLEYHHDKAAGDLAVVIALEGSRAQLEELSAQLERLDGLTSLELT